MTDVLGAMLPEYWSVDRLKKVVTYLSRGTAPEYVDDGPIRAISQAANQYGYLDWSRTRFHSHKGPASELKGYLKVNDILVNSTGKGTLGRVGFFDGAPDNIPCMADSHVTIVRTDNRVANSRFTYYWLNSQTFQDYIHSALIVGATNQIELNRERLSNAPLPIPSIEEQRRIADFLDAETARIDRFASTNERLLERLAERRATAVIDEVSGGSETQKRRSTLAWLEEVPQSWDEVRVGLLARMGSGHTPSRSRREWWQECTIPWITTGEVQQVRDDRAEVIAETREKISEIGLQNSAAELHPKGTVVLCRTASAGYSAVMGHDMATSQDFVTWTCGPRLEPFYLLWCLRAMRQDLLGRLAMGSTHKTIYVPDLQALRIPLPPTRKEQVDIVRRIRKNNERVDRLMDRVRQQSILLAERRRSLITAAVTGQFDVSTASGRGVAG